MAQTIREHLAKLTQFFEPELGSIAWTSERDRWNEMVFCILAAGRPQDELPAVRETSTLLGQLRLADFARLAAADRGRDPDAVIAILEGSGFTTEDAADRDRALAEFASKFAAAFGDPSAYFGGVGISVVNEIVGKVDSEALNESLLRDSLVVWLQNTMNLPILRDTEAVQSLCRQYNVSVQDVVDAADDLGVSLAVIDDLLVLADGNTEFADFLAADEASQP